MPNFSQKFYKLFLWISEKYTLNYSQIIGNFFNFFLQTLHTNSPRVEHQAVGACLCRGRRRAGSARRQGQGAAASLGAAAEGRRRAGSARRQGHGAAASLGAAADGRPGGCRCGGGGPAWGSGGSGGGLARHGDTTTDGLVEHPQEQPMMRAYPQEEQSMMCFRVRCRTVSNSRAARSRNTRVSNFSLKLIDC